VLEGVREGRGDGGIVVVTAGFGVSGVLVEAAGGGEAEADTGGDEGWAAGAEHRQPAAIIKTDIRQTSKNNRPFLILKIPITAAYIQPLVPIIAISNPEHIPGRQSNFVSQDGRNIPAIRTCFLLSNIHRSVIEGTRNGLLITE
jgi:hypothetical protein